MTQKAMRALAAMDFCKGFPLRYLVWAILDSGFQGTFEQLVSRCNSKAKRVSPHLLALWEAGFANNLPPGTPAQIVEGSASDALLIEGTCIDVTEVR